MRPVHVSPNCSARVVLEEHMILAAKVSRCAGIILPVSFGQQMELRPERIVHELFPERRRQRCLSKRTQEVWHRAKSTGREEEYPTIHSLVLSKAATRSIKSRDSGGVAPDWEAT